MRTALALLGAALLFLWIALASYTHHVTALWLSWAALFLALEGYTLFNNTPGDTMSGHLWRWARGGRGRSIVLGGLLLWLIWHLIWSPNIPR